MAIEVVMKKHPNHARQFRYTVKRPTDAASLDIMRWLFQNFGPSSLADLHNGVWFFHHEIEKYPYEPLYYFKHEKDAVYFRMTWE